MSLAKLDTPLEEMSAVQKRFLPKLKRLKLITVEDLLWHFPTRYEDWREIAKIAELKHGEERTVQGTIQSVNQVKTWQKRMIVTEALIGDGTGSIRAVWFNQPYIGQMLAEGKLINLAGKVSLSKKGDVYFSNPAYELISKINADDPRHTARIVPIYPETRGLTSKGIRFILKSVIDSVEKIPEFIPREILDELELPEINDAIRRLHMPEEMEDAAPALKRFAFQDLFLLQVRNITEKLSLKKQDAPFIKYDNEDIDKLLYKIPFKLTSSQEKSLEEILKDISNPHPMNRLLQGDVGSGKTIIAGIAALIAANEKNNLQTAFMAPTEILARQHYKTLMSLFDDFSGGIGLLLSKEARIFHGDELEDKTTKPNLIKGVAGGKVKIVIGTHALIQKNVEFDNLGLIVIDEQHRFGVRQRAELTKDKKLTPHFLSMSATPIPRTLMMSIFGNLALSLITELPAGRRKIITKIVDPENRDKAYAFIRGEVRKGRQVYVVCPRIEASDANSETTTAWDDVRAVEEEYEKLSKKVFPDLRVGMLHGKLKSAEKDSVMEKFSSGETDVLVSTSVIEVGVDVPNSTIMMIESADRFGLAQLYQFRGRVGRGEHQSFCFLFTDSHTDAVHKRLNSLIDAKNSFELAERDLEIRGPGELLGDSQSGLPDIAMKAIKNPKLLKIAKEKALGVVGKDSELKNYPELKKRLDKFGEFIHLE